MFFLDIQISGDGVVVVSHDPSSLRCFGVHHPITTTPYHGVLDKLHTADSFKEKMPTFRELATELATSPTYANMKLILDVKRTNEPWAISKVIEVLREVNPDIKGFWAKKMVLGIWRDDVLAAAETDAPELPIMFIGAKVSLAREFMKHSQVVGISIHHAVLNLRCGRKLIDEARAKNKLVYSWTVNSYAAMKWAASADLDGIVTDHPDLYHEFITSVSEKQLNTANPQSFFTWKELWLKFPLMFIVATIYFTLMDTKRTLFASNKKARVE